MTGLETVLWYAGCFLAALIVFFSSRKFTAQLDSLKNRSMRTFTQAECVILDDETAGKKWLGGVLELSEHAWVAKGQQGEACAFKLGPGTSVSVWRFDLSNPESPGVVLTLDDGNLRLKALFKADGLAGFLAASLAAKVSVSYGPIVQSAMGPALNLSVESRLKEIAAAPVPKPTAPPVDGPTQLTCVSCGAKTPSVATEQPCTCEYCGSSKFTAG